MIQTAARWRRQRRWRGGGEGVLCHGAVGLLSCAKKETSFRTLHCQATKGTAAGIYGAAVAKHWRGVAAAGHKARHYVDGDSALQQLLLPVLDSR